MGRKNNKVQEIDNIDKTERTDEIDIFDIFWFLFDWYTAAWSKRTDLNLGMKLLITLRLGQIKNRGKLT